MFSIRFQCQSPPPPEGNWIDMPFAVRELTTGVGLPYDSSQFCFLHYRFAEPEPFEFFWGAWCPVLTAFCRRCRRRRRRNLLLVPVLRPDGFGTQTVV